MTDDEAKQLAELWAAGVPIAAIAAELGVNPATVHRRAKRLGLPSRAAKPIPDTEALRKARDRAARTKDGDTIANMARLTGRSYWGVATAIAVADGRLPKSVSAAEADDIVRQYVEERMGLQQIASATGRGTRTITTVLTVRGVTRRPAGRPDWQKGTGTPRPPRPPAASGDGAPADLSAPVFSGFEPMCWLAALGLLDVLSRSWPERNITLTWSDGTLRPVPTWGGIPGATGSDKLDAATDAVMTDRDRWKSSITLGGPAWPESSARDLKVPLGDVRTWFDRVCDYGNDADLRLLHGFVSEFAGSGGPGAFVAKPTHLDFTAGQQRFLDIARKIRDSLTEADVRQALAGPWERRPRQSSFRWEPGVDRQQAYMATDPSKTPRGAVVGMEWLALLGLSFYPTMTVPSNGVAGDLRTTGFSGSWSSGAFTWQLWHRPITVSVARAMILAGPAPLDGTGKVCTAPYHRTARGYGAFAGTTAKPISPEFRSDDGRP